jgi:hypothetical protein
MGVDCCFSRSEALEQGVVFEEVKDTRLECDFFCPSNDGEHWCECVPTEVEYVAGYKVRCPDGAEGYAFGYETFQCKLINQEIRAWFMENLHSAELSY